MDKCDLPRWSEHATPPPASWSVIGAIVLILVIVASQPVIACTCLTPTLESAYHDATVVLRVRAISSQRDSIRYGNVVRPVMGSLGLVYTVAVTRIWKGEVPQRVYMRGAGSCSYSFSEVGQEIVVFATDPAVSGDTLYSSICSRPCCLSHDDLAKKLDYLTGTGQLSIAISTGVISAVGTVSGPATMVDASARLVVAPQWSIRARFGMTLSDETLSSTEKSRRLFSAMEGIYRTDPAFEALAPYFGAGVALTSLYDSTSDPEYGVIGVVGIDLPVWGDQFVNEFDIGWWSTLSFHVELQGMFLPARPDGERVLAGGMIGVQILW